METFSRSFKGIWIPKELWMDKRLSYFEKILAAEIDSLDDEVNHCFAGNDYFAVFFDERERKIIEGIAKLKALGFVELVSFNGRKRVLKSNLKTIYVKFEGSDLSNSAPPQCGFPQGSPIGASIETDIISYNTSDNKTVCPKPPASASKVKKLTSDRKEIEASKDDLYFQSVKFQKNWTTLEIEEAWDILVAYAGAVNDIFRFIEGTIDNLRKKENLEKMNAIKTKNGKKGEDQCLMKNNSSMEPTSPLDHDSLMRLFLTQGCALPT